MTIKKARELLGEEAKGLTDEEVQKSIETARFFADLMIDKIKNMSPSERRKTIKKT